MDEALASARKLVGDARAREMFGCDWGRKVSVPGNTTPCLRPAEERIVVHNGAWQIELRLCDEHGALVKAETEPHAQCGRPGCSGCGGRS